MDARPARSRPSTTSMTGLVSTSVATTPAYSTIATITPAMTLMGRNTSRLAGMTRAVATKSQGAGHSRSL